MNTTRIFGGSNMLFSVKLKGIVLEETFVITIDDENTVEVIDLVLDGDGNR
jgi:O-acetylhomoserine/O-acetylserine sulfhydrylase-like pyridoxal-dependent enzyme